MKEKFAELEKLLRETAKARQDVKVALAKLNASRKDYSPEYVKEDLEPQIAKAQAGMKALGQAGYEKAGRLLQELGQAAAEKHKNLKLDNPALTNALQAIQLAGDRLDGETVKRINQSFAGDQASLRLLRSAYKAKGVVSYGDLDDQIYEPNSAFENLREWAYDAFIREGSLNSFSNVLSKVTALEGIDFPKQIDEAGATDVMRAAAGLPEKAA